MSGKTLMEQFYQQAVLRYKDYPYADFHQYITWKLRQWYKKFPFGTTKYEKEGDSSAGTKLIQVAMLNSEAHLTNIN
jgi:hypothetical protein